MSDSADSRWLSISRLYETAQRLYSEVPYRWFRSGYAFPAWHYYFEVTRRCNLRCRMCQYIDWLENTPMHDQAEGELTTDEWHRVIDQVGRFRFVTFTGGEPFVRKDFMELLEHASRRARTHFISNTTMMPQDRAERVVALAPARIGGMGLNFIGTSLEAPGGLHDEIRHMEGAFDRSIAGMRTLRAIRDRAGKRCPMIHVTTVIQKDNVHVLHLMPKVVADAGGEVLNLVTETRQHDLPGLGEADPGTFRADQIAWPRIDPAALAGALDKTETAAREAGIELRLPRMPRADLVRYYDSQVDLRDYECRNAWNTLFIGRKGDAYPCWIVKVGNVRGQSLAQLWNNGVMRGFRKACQKHLFAMCPGCCFIDHKGGSSECTCTDRSSF